ncbi:MAG: FkbM family methyltransferase [Pseudomonadota bacterium]
MLYSLLKNSKIPYELTKNAIGAISANCAILKNTFQVHGNAVPNLSIIKSMLQSNCKNIPTILGQEVRAYGQYGEDIIIKSLLQASDGKRYDDKKVTYLDIGANHAINMSNTWLLYQDGMKGVLVEPNPDLHQDLENLRPNDKLIRGGVSVDSSTESKLYVSDHHELASFSKDFIDNYYKNRSLKNKSIKEVTVKTYDINDLIEQEFPEKKIDFLNIDVETLDYDVLVRIDFSKIDIKIICIEPSDCFLSDLEISNTDRISNLLTSKGYRLVAVTPANMIFLAQ